MSGTRRRGAISNLLPWVGMTFAIWLTLQFYDAGEHHWIDHALTISLALSSAFAAIIMIESQREWRTRAIGVFFLTVGWTVLFGAIEAYRLWAAPPAPPQPATNPYWYQASTDAVRALTFVGSLLLVHGLLEYRFRPESVDAWNGKNRRNESPGRRATDQVVE